MTDDTARADHEYCVPHDHVEPSPARPSGLLDGYFEPFTCPDCRLWVAGHAEDCPALAATEPELDVALRDFMEERLEDAHEMTPAEERLMKVARAALAATEPGLDE